MPAVRPRLLTATVAAAVLLLVGCSSGGRPDITADPPANSRASTSHSTTPATSTPPRTTVHETAAARAPRSVPRPPAARAPAPKPAAAPALPLPYPTGDARQVLTVVAASTTSTGATVQAWQQSAGRWSRYGPLIAAHLGADGMTDRPSESQSATPMGSFGLTQAFGSAPDPGLRLPYFRTGTADWWVSDATSPYYNTHVRCVGSCPFDTTAGENLADAGALYTYAVVIDYNRFPVTPGAGSAFFLHVTDGAATAGCVSMPEPQLRSIMQWLDPAAHPRVLIGTA